MPLKVVSLGYVGFGNLGDEAVLAGIRSSLRSRPVFRDADWTVLTANNESTARLHPDVRPAPRWRWREMADRCRGTDLFVLGGGSLLQDATSVRSVLWYCLMASIARTRSRRVLWWGHGIGPLRSSLSRRLVRGLAAKADAISVRDRDSAQLLKECGFSGSVEVVADPAFLLQPIKNTGAKQGALLAMRLWGGRVPELPLDSLPAPLRSLPMHHPVDNGLVSGVADIDWSGSSEPWTDVLAALAHAEVLVSMRLHALILASISGTPFVALSYDPKVDALAKMTGQSDVAISVSEASRAAIADRIALVRASSARRSAALLAVSRELADEAALPARRASSWWE